LENAKSKLGSLQSTVSGISKGISVANFATNAYKSVKGVGVIADDIKSGNTTKLKTDVANETKSVNWALRGAETTYKAVKSASTAVANKAGALWSKASSLISGSGKEVSEKLAKEGVEDVGKQLAEHVGERVAVTVAEDGAKFGSKALARMVPGLAVG